MQLFPMEFVLETEQRFSDSGATRKTTPATALHRPNREYLRPIRNPFVRCGDCAMMNSNTMKEEFHITNHVTNLKLVDSIQKTQYLSCQSQVTWF